MTKFKTTTYFFLKALPTCCLLLLSCVAWAQSIQTKIDRKDILIGQQINYSLQFTLPSKAYQIEFSIPDSLPHFEILHKEKTDSVDGAGNFLVTQKLVFTSFDSGSWTLPALPMKIRNSSNQAVYSLNADPVTINVGYMPADSSGQLRTIKPIFSVFYIEREWWIWAIAIALTLLTAFLLYKYLKRKPKKAAVSNATKLLAIDEARDRLKKLAQINPQGLFELKNYYTELNNIFKNYYSRSHHQNFDNKTTSQVLMSLKEDGYAAEVISDIAAVLRLAVAVKFAKYEPSAENNKEQINKVASVIETMHRVKNK